MADCSSLAWAMSQNASAIRDTKGLPPHMRLSPLYIVAPAAAQSAEDRRCRRDDVCGRWRRLGAALAVRGLPGCRVRTGFGGVRQAQRAKAAG